MKALADMGMEKVSHIESGFNGWRDAELPVVEYADWKAAKSD